MSEITQKGSCLCEAVEFRLTGEPENIFICYCSHCSKGAGGSNQISAKYKAEQLKIVKGEDATTTYVLNGTLSGAPKHKVFCSICGCTLWTIPMKHGGSHTIVRTAMISDGLSSLKPRVEFFSSYKVEYPDEIKSFPTMPGH
ncbi:hypothetical protein IQ07DRAFT_659006 [Pyrenochaeta sp. DS3sAY3a]|nr:hypothetical protein IQ07DRAFT_659006 [Pyrenochaeta sp. DS3sAY3a]